MFGLRLKIAIAFKPFPHTEYVEWKRWLKPSVITARTFCVDLPYIQQKKVFSSWLIPAEVYMLEFKIENVDILQHKSFEKFLKVQATKSKPCIFNQIKTNRLFFSLTPVRISEKLFLSKEQPGLVFTIFNSKTHSVPPGIKNIEIKYFIPQVKSVEYLLKEELVSQNLIPTDIYEIETGLDRWDLRKSAPAILSIPIRRKETQTKIVAKDKAGFFRDTITLSSNLLHYDHTTALVKEEFTSGYFLNNIDISSNLLSLPVETFNISLLDKALFSSSTYKLKQLILTADKETAAYSSGKLELSSHIKLVKSVWQGLKIKNNGFRGYTIESFEKPGVSPNLVGKIQSGQMQSTVKSDLILRQKIVENTKQEYKETNEIPYACLQNYDPFYFPVLYEQSKDEIGVMPETENLLYKFQQEGAKLLLNHSIALLLDEDSLNRPLQAIIALKSLFKKKKIRQVLIVHDTLEPESGRITIPNNQSWQYQLQTFVPELNIVTLETEENNRISSWHKAADIFRTTYNDLLSDEAGEVIAYERLKQFDCIILDDYRSFNLTVFQRDRIFGKLKLRFLWILDNSPKEYFGKELIKFFSSFTTGNLSKSQDNYATDNFILQRSQQEVSDELPRKIYRTRWLEMNEQQSRDYKTIVEQGQVKLSASIEQGNLFILRPQIFTLLHEIFQVQNFSSLGNTSGKAKLLTEEIMKIKEAGRKVVVFSQYEKFGLKRLEEILTEQKIGFVTFRSGANLQSVEKSCQNFRNDKTITVFLADVKAVTTNLDLGNFNTIIHFDQWWNLASLWQLEDRVCASNKSRVTIEYYRTVGSMDVKISEMLSKAGLDNRLIVESISPNVFAELISNEEWMELFGLNSLSETSDTTREDLSNKAESVLKQIDYEAFRKLITNLFFKIGFSKINLVNPDLEIDRITFQAGKMIAGHLENIMVELNYKREINEDSVNEFQRKLDQQKTIKKGIIITTEHFSPACKKYSVVKDGQIILIDRELLIKYFLNLKII